MSHTSFLSLLFWDRLSNSAASEPRPRLPSFLDVRHDQNPFARRSTSVPGFVLSQRAASVFVALVGVTLAVLLISAAVPDAAQASDKEATPAAPTPPPVKVRVQTSAGAFTIQVNVARAPLTAANFLQYVHDGFYEGTIVHRVVEGFIIQGGGFLPNYELKPTRASIANESGNGLSNVRGSVGLARADDPYSGNAQFFINLADNAMLDPQTTRWGYAVFGTVVDGMEVLEQMSHAATGNADGKAGPLKDSIPIKQIVIQKIEELK